MKSSVADWSQCGVSNVGPCGCKLEAPLAKTKIRGGSVLGRNRNMFEDWYNGFQNSNQIGT